MAFSDDFNDLLRDTITWNEFTSRDVFGQPTYGSGNTYKARLVKKSKLVRDQNGDEVTSSFHIWIGRATNVLLDAPPDIQPDDEIVLSDGTSPTILTIDYYQDDTDTPSHTKVFFR